MHRLLIVTYYCSAINNEYGTMHKKVTNRLRGLANVREAHYTVCVQFINWHRAQHRGLTPGKD